MDISIKDAETGNKLNMSVVDENTIEEIIEQVADYWKKDPGAYVLRFGKKVLRGPMTVVSTGVHNEDVLELIPDPEGG